MTVETARLVLDNRTLRWSAPQLFNDPFEFKSPFALGFEWEDLERPFYDEYFRILTQVLEPNFAPSKDLVVLAAIAAREFCKGRDHTSVKNYIESGYPRLLEAWKKGAQQDQQKWEDWKREYRILCFSAVSDSILMWSHYARNHQGVVFAFEPKLELDSALLAARPVFYAREVPNAGTLAEFVKYVTGQWLQRN